MAGMMWSLAAYIFICFGSTQVFWASCSTCIDESQWSSHLEISKVIQIQAASLRLPDLSPLTSSDWDFHTIWSSSRSYPVDIDEQEPRPVQRDVWKSLSLMRKQDWVHFSACCTAACESLLRSIESWTGQRWRSIHYSCFKLAKAAS